MATSSSIRTTEKTFSSDPMVPVQTFKQQSKELLRGITGQSELEAKAGTAAGAASQASAEANARGTVAQATAAGMDRDQRVNVAALMGIGELDALTVQRAQADAAKDDLRQRIVEESNVQVWDDPLRWVVNKFTLPVLKNTYNNVNRTSLEASQRINERLQQAQVRQNVDLAPTGDLIRQHGAEVAAAQALAGIAANQELLGKAAHVRTQALMQSLAVSQSTADMTLRALNMQAQTLAISQGERDAKALLPVLTAANEKRKSAGLREIPEAEFKLYTNGQKTELLQWASVPGYGATPGQAAEWIFNSGATATLPTANPAVTRQLSDMMALPDFKKKMDARIGANPKFAAEPIGTRIGTIVDEIAAEQTAAAVNASKAGGGGNNGLDVNNRYRLQIATAALNPRFANNVLAKDLLTEITANPAAPKTEADVLRIFKAQSIANQGKPQMLEKLTQDAAQFFREGMLTQYGASGMAVLGWKHPGDMGYSLSGVDPSSSPRMIQAFNPTDWAHLQVQTVRQKQGSVFASENPFTAFLQSQAAIAAQGPLAGKFDSGDNPAVGLGDLPGKGKK